MVPPPPPLESVQDDREEGDGKDRREYQEDLLRGGRGGRWSGCGGVGTENGGWKQGC